MKTKIKNGVLDNLEDAGIIDITTNKQETMMQNRDANVSITYQLVEANVGNDGYTQCVHLCTITDKATGEVLATKAVPNREESANCDLSSLISITPVPTDLPAPDPAEEE